MPWFFVPLLPGLTLDNYHIRVSDRRTLSSYDKDQLSRGCTSEPVLSVLSTTSVTCFLSVGTPRLSGVAFILVIIKVHLGRAFLFGWRFRHHTTAEGAIVEAKAMTATDIFISHHSLVYLAVHLLSRGCTCIASPCPFRDSSLVNFSESTRMIGIIVHSAYNPTYTLQRQSCVVATERLIFLKMGKRNHRTRVSFERARSSEESRTLEVVFGRDPPGKQIRLLLTVTNDEQQPNYQGNSSIYRASFSSTRKRAFKKPGPPPGPTCR